ncbi:5-(carboxyamino)imidazole ribonucleotide synthase [Massilia sp. PAMC28688]|uniref:5-(carboxyamino)imidazole ribonucleotide synthase n=1 Tax=Massilia sp. PAMC28688 TaxID=2861283 RepID=UPI001C62E141|nr:5-(carboxyamino)imidazole ribonucleotide synthase [Massilia sp. PAMC28688]QYF95694.1 5-(carboxyamino)imidazole ribonucleotide synthase [Massilia sp. PAMC28688]
MNIAVLGNGQLGAMMQQAGLRIGVEVQLLDIDAGQLASPDMIVTAEREHWPQNAFTTSLAQAPGWLNAKAFHHLADRIRQKTFITELGLPTSPWRVFRTDMGQEGIHAQLGPDVFLKSPQGGYDGRGQLRLKQATPAALPFPAWADQSLAEQAIAFDTEVSIIGARGRDGQMVFYRLTENRHQDGVLAFSISRPGAFEALQAPAEDMLRTLMTALDYVGVMAVECFVVDGKLLINEIAPRVHNSGHWTQAAASISQFELHVRAVCGMPLPEPVQQGAAIMANLLGVAYDQAWLAHGAAQLHWYGKDYRPGRKMGHINLASPDVRQLAQWLGEMTLPAELEASRSWAIQRLAS